MSIGFLFPSFRRVCKDEICHVVGPSYGKFTMLVVGVAIFFAAMHAALDRRVIDKLSSLTRVKTH